MVRRSFIVLIILSAAGLAWAQSVAKYPWLGEYKPADSVAARITPPEGFKRADAVEGSFAAWLRGVPLKPGRPPVHLFDGRPKANQEAHHAVIDLDVGSKDLQQCADSVIRLRAEWLYSLKRLDDLHFNFTSGDRCEFAKWAQGFRPTVAGNKVTWRKTAEPDASCKSFRAWLDVVFSYAGTLSLSGELSPVRDLSDVRIGDVFIQGGSPGHVVIVIDVVENPRSGERAFLLAQGYMPAQEMHVLRNPNDAKMSPWYPVNFGDTLKTPEYTFRRGDLRRF